MNSTVESTRLLHITTVPLSLKFLSGQVGYMQRRNLTIHVLSSPGHLLTEFADREGATPHAVTMLRQISPLQDIGAIARLWGRIRRVKPQIVHAHTPKGGLLGMISAWLARTPIRIYHMRGLPLMTATGGRRWLLWWSEKVACLLADRVMCVSHSLREVAIAENLCSPSKIQVLLGGSGNGVDAMDRFNPDRLEPTIRSQIRQRYDIPDDAIVLGFVGRIVRDKGIHELMQAWQMLRDSFPSAHLLVVGPTEPQDPVHDWALSMLQSDPRIHSIGTEWNTPPLFAAMDVVVLPTYREGFPNVLLEAAAMQLPVVATQIPGCIDAVNPEVTGLLVPVQQSAALAAAVERYFKNPELRDRHGRAGRERVLQHFCQDRLWEALYQQYHQLLDQKNETPRGYNHLIQ